MGLVLKIKKLEKLLLIDENGRPIRVAFSNRSMEPINLTIYVDAPPEVKISREVESLAERSARIRIKNGMEK